MGWNSWNFFAGKITGELTKSAADSMVKTGLIDHGWTYINIDDTWEAKRDAAGKILANEKFPDMKGLSDYIHAQGLKFGIYSSPGPQTCAHYEATYGHEDQDAQSYADWGVDYVKYDWCSYSTIAAKLTTDRYAAAMSPEDAAKYNADLARRATIPPPPRGRRGGAGAAPAGQAARGGPTTQQIAEYQQLSTEITALVAKIDPAKKKQIDLLILQEPYALFRKSLDKVDRDIVYSLCQYGDGNVWTWGGDVGGNLWRTTGDIRANWQSMTNIGFAQNDHAKYASPGHWNDPDMLEVGNGTLTPDENYTHMTLWCMLSAPLLIGCDMPHMDAFTVSLFTNDEVLAVDQDALGHQGSRAKQDGLLEVWTKPLADGTMAVALFNRTDASATISATWADLKLTGPTAVRDLWRQKNVDQQTDGVSATVASHGAELFRVGTPRS
jgi:hypothetical protein